MGYFSMAKATALARSTDTVTPLGLTALYSASKASISISRVTRKMGVDMVASILLLTARCMPVNGTKPEGNSFGAAAVEEDDFRTGLASPVATLTSCAVTRPKPPVPSMVAKSILAFLANARAVGVAGTTPSAGVQAGVLGAAAAAGGAFPVEGAEEAAFSTSPAVIRPLGPVPATVDKSNPKSFARFLAKGDATTRAPGAATAAGLLGAADFGAAGAAAATAAGGAAPPRVAAYC
mmetsp:Transcript_29953/g.28838  ORF Transcript_29953/g.28838 Transcript_29953/m.28838 type:complete len:236 (-) Transcript_29953:953-1660(-)